MSRELRVGLLVITALVVLGLGIFFVGEQKRLFARKNRYTIQFESVGGLNTGNPVQLNGVNVGNVEEIYLPESPEKRSLTVRVRIDRRYAARVREDSLARIKTLGLLGDKYVEVTSGTSGHPQIPEGGEIPAAPATQVDQLIASGEDVVENLVAISVSARSILGRLERGEGLLGEMTMDTESGSQLKSSLMQSAEALASITGKIESGQGVVGRLLTDDRLVTRLETSIERLDGILAALQGTEGLVPAMVNDPELRGSLETTLDSLQRASESLSAVAAEVEEGNGLLAKLLTDEEYGAEVSRELREMLENLNRLSQELSSGDGTAAQLINDPQVYDALNDILVGVNESKLLRWLIRNRQKAGIRKRYEEEHSEADPGSGSPSQPEAANPSGGGSRD